MYKPAHLSSIIYFSSLCFNRILQGHSLDYTQDLPSDMLGQKASISAYIKQSIRDHGITTKILAEYISAQQLKKTHVHVLNLLKISMSALLNNFTQAHTLINQAVQAAKMHKHSFYACGLINAILRKVVINLTFWQSQTQKYTFIPEWWQNKIRQDAVINAEDYMRYIQDIPNMALRVNTQKCQVDMYLEYLKAKNISAQSFNLHNKYSPFGIVIEKPIDVYSLPFFEEGYVSVQDISAQIVPQILPLKNGMKVLDACSAPGGKILSCLEQYALNITLLDINEQRMQKTQKNITRLQVENQILSCTQHVADASQLDWWNGDLFDVVIADVPCSASGIVRKQPEIALLRSEADVYSAQQIQAKILANLWHTLKKSGILVYISCSVFADEGKQQIQQFLHLFKNACLLPLAVSHISVCKNHDGFFYALLQKQDE
jgi:16S rRNA (cytosine967-C5)-methyltransferase